MSDTVDNHMILLSLSRLVCVKLRTGLLFEVKCSLFWQDDFIIYVTARKI